MAEEYSSTDPVPTTPKKQPRIFYGWWIIAGCFLIMATCYTIFINCIPLFQAHIVQDLNFSMGEFNLGVAICTVVAIFASLGFGAIVGKVSSRILGGFTVIVTAVVLVLFSFIQELWQFYTLCLIAGMIVVAGTRLLASVLAANWFTLRRGLAVSIALSGSGFGGVLLSPLTSMIIVNYGWRPAFLLLAAICLAAALPLAITVFHNRPSEKGLLPFGSDNQLQTVEKKNDKAVRKVADQAVTIAVGWRVLLRSIGFWQLILGFVMMGVINGAVITNAVSNMTSVTLNGTEIITGGHDTIWAGNVWAMYLAVVIVGKVALGAIYDRFGLKAGTVVGTVACLIASIALCFPTTDWAPLLAALTFGFGTCMGTVSPPVMVVKEYGKKDLGVVTGIVTAFELFGAAIGAVVSGIFFDAYLTFLPAWLMTLAAGIIMGVTLLGSIPAAQRIVSRCRDAGAAELDAEGIEIA
jgi:MFS family permease